MRKLFVSAGFIIAVVISAVLENKFANYEKNIVTLALTAIYFLYWTGEFIYSLVMFHKTFPERYKLFVAETVNKKKLSLDIINAEEKYYKRKFRQTLIKEKFIYYVEIALALGAAIALIVAIFI